MTPKPTKYLHAFATCFHCHIPFSRLVSTKILKHCIIRQKRGMKDKMGAKILQ